MHTDGAGRLHIVVSFPEGGGGIVEVDFGSVEGRGGSDGRQSSHNRYIIFVIEL